MIRKWALILAAWLPLSLLSAEPAGVPSLLEKKVITNGGFRKSHMETRIYDVSPSFEWDAKHAEKNGLLWPTPAATDDPFSSGPSKINSNSTETDLPRVQFLQSTRAFLEHADIPFPPGAAAFLDPINHRLHVRHEAHYLDVIQHIIEAQRPPATIAITVHLIQAPGPVLRSLARHSKDSADKSLELKHLLLEAERPESQVQVLQTGHLLTKSGERSSLEAVTQRLTSSEIELDHKGASTVKSIRWPLGFRLEIESSIQSGSPYVSLHIDPDFSTLPITQAHVQFREPATGNVLKMTVPQSQNSSIRTSIRIKTGHSQLLSLQKPQTPPEQIKADLLQALFVTAEIISVKPLPKEHPDVVQIDLTQPDALIKHTFTLPNSNWLEVPHMLNENEMTAVKILRAHYIELPEKGQATITDPRHLTVEANLETMDIIQQWVAEQWQSLPKTTGLTLNILRGPGPLLRRALSDSQGQSDQSNVLKQMHAAVSRGEAHWVSTTYLQANFGTKCKSQAVREHNSIGEIAWTGHPGSAITPQTTLLGTVWEAEPMISPDGHSVHLSGEFTWQTAPPTSWEVNLHDPASKTDFAITRHDFHEASVKTSTIFAAGQSRIVAAWHPRGSPELETQDVLELAVVTVDVLKSTSAETAPKPTPLLTSPSVNGKQMMVSRTIPVSPDFLSLWNAPKDFTPGKKTRNQMAFEILKAATIPMPEGSEVIYVAGSDELILTNTLANINMAEALMGVYHDYYGLKDVIFNLHLFEAKGDLIRDILTRSARHADHSEELKELSEGLTNGETVTLETLRMVTSAGQRATMEHIREHLQTLTFNKEEGGKTSVIPEVRGVGTRMEIDPMVHADGTTININLAPEHHTAPPISHLASLTPKDAAAVVGYPLADFHFETINTSLTMASGTARILAVWKPTGKPEYEEHDLLHIAILEAAAVGSEK